MSVCKYRVVIEFTLSSAAHQAVSTSEQETA